MNVLCEWAFHVRISDHDVDTERGVILQEIRTKQGASARIKHDFWTVALPGVAARPPIGTVACVTAATSASLRRFYDCFYVAENMAVAAVVELCTSDAADKGPSALSLASLTRLLDDAFLNGRRNARAAGVLTRTFADLAGTGDAVRFVSAVDADLSARSVSIELLAPLAPTADAAFVKRDLVRRVLSSALDARFKTMSRRHAQTLLRAGVSFGLVLHAPAVELSAVKVELASSAFDTALEVLVAQLRGLFTHGFAHAEVARAKRKWAHFFDSRQLDHAGGGALVEEFVEHFMLGERAPLMPRDEEAAIVRHVLAELTAADVSAYAREWLRPLMQGRGGVVVVAAQSPPAGAVSEAALKHAWSRAMMAAAAELGDGSASVNGHDHGHGGIDESTARFDVDDLAPADVCALVFASSECAQAKPTADAAHVVRAELPRSQATLYSLHGHRVCIRKRASASAALQSGKISVQGFSLGGASELAVVDDDDDAAAAGTAAAAMVDDAALMLAPDAVRESGAGALSGAELEAVEDRFHARVHLQRHLLHRGVGGSCDVKHDGAFDVLLALLAARLAVPHRVDQAVFDRLLVRHAQPVEGTDAAAAQCIRAFAYGDDEDLLRPLPPEAWRAVTRQHVERMANAAFSAGAGPWTLCFVGALPNDDAWAARLLHCLCAAKPCAPWLRSSTQQPRQLRVSRVPPALTMVHVGSDAEADKASVVLCMAADVDCADDVGALLQLNVAADVIKTRLVARMRTESAAVYAVAVDVARTSLSCSARVFVAFAAAASEAPARREAALAEIARLAVEGPTAEEAASVAAATRLALKGKTTDGHVLFRLLDAFKARGGGHVDGVDELASPDCGETALATAVRNAAATIARLHARSGALEMYPPLKPSPM